MTSSTKSVNVGDRVRVVVGHYAGQAGTVSVVHPKSSTWRGRRIDVHLDQEAAIFCFSPEELTASAVIGCVHGVPMTLPCQRCATEFAEAADALLSRPAVPTEEPNK